MPAESAYRKACEAACTLCKQYGPQDYRDRGHWNSEGVIEDCTGPSIEVFAQSQALGRVAAEKRAEAAEQELRAWKGALQLECTCDSDVLGRAVIRCAAGDQRERGHQHPRRSRADEHRTPHS